MTRPDHLSRNRPIDGESLGHRAAGQAILNENACFVPGHPAPPLAFFGLAAPPTTGVIIPREARGNHHTTCGPHPDISLTRPRPRYGTGHGANVGRPDAAVRIKAPGTAGAPYSSSPYSASFPAPVRGVVEGAISEPVSGYPAVAASATGRERGGASVAWPRTHQ